MFWGLILEPHKRYTQVVNKAFHVSMASLDLKGKNVSDESPAQIVLTYEDRKYIICNLIGKTHPQQKLDLNFDTGSKITFINNGNSYVHLTGYHIQDSETDDEDVEDMYDSLDVDSFGEVEENLKKRKMKSKSEKPSKKIKKEMNESQEEEEDEDDEDEDMESDDDSTVLDENEDEEMSDEEEDEEVDDEEEEDDTDKEEESEDGEKKKSAEPAKEEETKKSKKQQKKEKQQLNGHASPAEKSKQENNQQQKSNKRTLEGGVVIEDIQIGNGPTVKKNSTPFVYYIGRLSNGKKFDSLTKGKGLHFKMGHGDVIRGWEIGIAGMRVGGKRRLTIPPSLGYGSKGSPPVIPPNSTLIFEIELKNLR